MIDVSQKMIYIVDGKSVKKIPYMRVPMIVLTSSTVETSRDVTAADSLPTQAFVVVRSKVGASCYTPYDAPVYIHKGARDASVHVLIFDSTRVLY